MLWLVAFMLITNHALDAAKARAGFSVVRLDQRTGQVVWLSRASVGIRLPRISVTDDTLVLTSSVDKGRRMALDLDSGDMRAEVPMLPVRAASRNKSLAKSRLRFDPLDAKTIGVDVGDSRITKRLEYYASSAVMLNDGRVVIALPSYGAIQCLENDLGHLSWEFSLIQSGWIETREVDLGVSQGDVFVCADQVLWCLDPADGREVWRCPLPRQEVTGVSSASASMWFVGDRVILKCWEMLFSIGREAGTLQWHFDCGSGQLSDPAVSDNGIWTLVGRRERIDRLKIPKQVLGPVPVIRIYSSGRSGFLAERVGLREIGRMNVRPLSLVADGVERAKVGSELRVEFEHRYEWFEPLPVLPAPLRSEAEVYIRVAPWLIAVSLVRADGQLVRSWKLDEL